MKKTILYILFTLFMLNNSAKSIGNIGSYGQSGASKIGHTCSMLASGALNITAAVISQQAKNTISAEDNDASCIADNSRVCDAVTALASIYAASNMLTMLCAGNGEKEEMWHGLTLWLLTNLPIWILLNQSNLGDTDFVALMTTTAWLTGFAGLLDLIGYAFRKQ